MRSFGTAQHSQVEETGIIATKTPKHEEERVMLDFVFLVSLCLHFSSGLLSLQLMFLIGHHSTAPIK
jgi:hypothetical protein